MVAALLMKLKELTVINSSVINFFFRERYIHKKHTTNKTEFGKNIVIFFLTGLLILLLMKFFSYNEWIPVQYFFIISCLIIIASYIIAKLINEKPIAEALSNALEQKIPITREYGEAGEIPPQFREPKKMNRRQRFFGWIEFIVMIVFSLIFISGFGFIVIQFVSK